MSQFSKTAFLMLAALAVLTTFATDYAHADVLMLKGGGKIEGDLLNPDEKPRTKYVVRVSTGGRITVDADRVEKVVVRSAIEAKYESYVSRISDTAEHNWKLSEWCRENKLFDERKFHLEQVIKHDPEHAQARRALGYHKLEGSWVKPDEWNAEQGYVRDGGAWRTSKEVAILQRNREIELAQKGWRTKVRRLRASLNSRRAQQAQREILDIRDPLAAPALDDQLRREKVADVRRMLLGVLGQIEGSAATDGLIRAALTDSSKEIRLDAIDHLKKRGGDRAVGFCITELKNKSNQRINNAAVLLGRLKNPEAILPLVDALVTKHRAPAPQSQSFSAGFSGNGGIGFGAGGGPKVVETTKRNRSVLDALISITGQNFQYSEEDWLRWYVSRDAPTEFSLRRDE